MREGLLRDSGRADGAARRRPPASQPGREASRQAAGLDQREATARIRPAATGSIPRGWCARRWRGSAAAARAGPGPASAVPAPARYAAERRRQAALRFSKGAVSPAARPSRSADSGDRHHRASGLCRLFRAQRTRRNPPGRRLGEKGLLAGQVDRIVVTEERSSSSTTRATARRPRTGPCRRPISPSLPPIARPFVRMFPHKAGDGSPAVDRDPAADGHSG